MDNMGSEFLSLFLVLLLCNCSIKQQLVILEEAKSKLETEAMENKTKMAILQSQFSSAEQQNALFLQEMEENNKKSANLEGVIKEEKSISEKHLLKIADLEKELMNEQKKNKRTLRRPGQS